MKEGNTLRVYGHAVDAEGKPLPPEEGQALPVIAEYNEWAYVMPEIPGR